MFDTITVDNIQNIPAHCDLNARPFVVYTEDWSERPLRCWYYGAYADRDEANAVAMEIGGSVHVMR